MQTRRLIKLPDVEAKTGQRKSWIYTRIAEGNFPRQVQIGPGAVAWVEAEVDAWIADCVAERDQRETAIPLRRKRTDSRLLSGEP